MRLSGPFLASLLWSFAFSFDSRLTDEKNAEMIPNKPPNHQTDRQEEGVEIPYQEINPETLRNMIEEFVSRDGSDWGDAGGSMEAKIEQVLRQFKAGKIKVVFDLTSQSANIILKV